MPVLSLLNQKGGVGKSTLAVNIAAAAAAQSVPVEMIDADPQASLAGWRDLRAAAGYPAFGITTVATTAAAVIAAARSASIRSDLVVIDGPPRTTDVARGVIAASDLVVIPVGASPIDIAATRDILALVEESRQSGGKADLQVVAVLNRIPIGTALARAAPEAIEAMGVPVVGTIGARVAFAEAWAAGLSVIEYEPGGKAAAEIAALADTLFDQT